MYDAYYDELEHFANDQVKGVGAAPAAASSSRAKQLEHTDHNHHHHHHHSNQPPQHNHHHHHHHDDSSSNGEGSMFEFGNSLTVKGKQKNPYWRETT